MDEQVIQDLYDRAISLGYPKSKEEFISLLQSDSDVQNDNYEYVKNQGYPKSMNDFLGLVGVGGQPQQEPKRAKLSYQAVPEQAAPTAERQLMSGLESKIPGFEQEMTQREAKKKEVLQSDLSSQQSLVESTARQQEEASSSASQRYEAATEKFPILRNELLKDIYQQVQKEEDLPSFVKDQLNSFDAMLISKGEFKDDNPLGFSVNRIIAETGVEEAVVPKMNYMFGPLGFKFEETGAGDYMTVTAPNGEAKEISLNNFTFEGNVEETKKLKDFIASNATKIPKIEKYAAQYAGSNAKLKSEKDIDTYSLSIAKDYESLNKDAAILSKDIASFEASLEELNSTPVELRSTSEYINKKKSVEAALLDINTRRQEIIGRNSQIEANKTNLDKAVGKYSDMKAEQGTWAGATYTWLGETAAGLASSALDVLIDFSSVDLTGDVSQQRQEVINKSVSDNIATGIPEQDAKNGGYVVDVAIRLNNYNKQSDNKDKLIPEPKQGQSYKDWYNSLNAEQQAAIRVKVEDDITKRAKQLTISPVRESIKGSITDANTSVEWRQLAEEGFWGGAYAGLVKSAPAMAMPGGWAARTAAFFAQSSDAVKEEMDRNPAFAEVPESEKLLVTIPIGIANAVLEEVGLSNMIKNKGFVNSLVLKGLQKAGVNATETTLSKIIKNDVESMAARGALTLAGAGLAEAETGAGQQIAEYAVKDIYNIAKEKEMFDTPDSLKEYVYDVVRSGAQEAVGGFIMGTPSAAAAAYRKQGFNGMSDEQFETFEAIANDEKMQSSFIATLKTKVAAGDMTMAEAKEELNDYRNAVGLYRSVDTNLTIEAKKEAMNLIREKQSLKQQIEGKDEAIVSRQKKRIEEINVQLNNLSENAVQKQTTSEVPIQSETAVSEEVAGGKPTAESQVTTEKGKEEVVTTTEQVTPIVTETTTLTPEEQSRKELLESWLEIREEEEKKGNNFFMEGFPTEENPNRKPTRITFDEAQAELDALNAKATPTAEVTATEEVPAAEGPLTEMQKAQQQLDRVESQINPNANHPLFNVGQQHNDGNKYRVFSSEDERTDRTKDGVEIITKVYDPATVDENGKMLSIATVQVTTFDSYEQAQEFINANYAKYKAIAEEKLAKVKTTKATTETKPVDLSIAEGAVERTTKILEEDGADIAAIDADQELDAAFEAYNELLKTDDGTLKGAAKAKLTKAERKFRKLAEAKGVKDYELIAYKRAKKELAAQTAVETAPVVEAAPVAEVTTTEEAPKRMTREELEAKRKELREENKKAKENAGENIKVKDYKTKKKRGHELKVGDVYARRINNIVYVFKVLSKPRKYYGQFYNIDVEVLHAGSQAVQKMIDETGKITEIGEKVGDKTIDTFKNLSSTSGKITFGEVTVLENFEAAPEAKTEAEPEAAPAVKEAPVAEAAPAAEEKPTAKPKEEPAKGKSLLTDKVRKQIDDIAKAWKKTREKYIKRTGEEPESDIELEIHVYNGDGEQDIDDTIEFTGVKNIDKVIEQIRKQYPNLGRIDFKYPERADGKDWNWITIYEVPAPVAEAAPAPKAEPAPTPAPAPAKKTAAEKRLDEDINQTSNEIEYFKDKIEELKEEIATEKGNTKEEIANVKEKIANIKATVTSKATQNRLIQELKDNLGIFKEDQENQLEIYAEDMVQLKADLRKAEAKLKRLEAKKAEMSPAAEVEAEAAPEKSSIMTIDEVRERFPLAAEFIDSIGIKIDWITSTTSLSLLVSGYDTISKSKQGAEKTLLQIAELEDLAESLYQITKKVSKEEFKKQIAESGDFDKKQLKIFNALIDSLQAEIMPEYMSKEEASKYDAGGNFYINALNKIISKEPEAFIHEVGHFGFFKILSKEDRLNFYRYMIDSNYGKGKPSLASRLAVTADTLLGLSSSGQENRGVSNAADNFSEYFAEQFRQWYMNERLFPKDIEILFDKVAQFFNLFIEKLKSGKYVDKNLSEYFNKISAKIEKDQKKNQKIQEELGIEETMMNELQDLEDFFGIDPAISPMSMRYDTPLQKMALMYNMTESGFFPRNASEPHINKDFFQFGLKAKRASSGSYYLVNINTGKMVKPLQRPKGGIPPQVSRMSVTPISVKDMAMEDVIDTARENGFSDDTIKALLIKRGYDPKEVDSALTFNVNFASAYTNNNPTKDSPLPQAFRTIDGGVSDGIKLFFDVRNALIDFAQTTKKKGMKAGKRVRTYAEIRAKAIELLEANPIFQAQTDTKQKELIAAFDKTLNIKRGKLVSAQIAEIRKALKERLVGMKDLKKAQLILRNFIRQSLPAVKVPRVFFTLDGLMSPAEGINYYNNLRKQVYDFARTGADGKMGKKILKTSEEIKDFAISLIKDSELYKKQTTDVQSDMVNGFINSEYTKGLNNTLDIYSQKEVNKLIDIVSQTDAKNLLAQAEKVFDIITEQRNKIKAGLLKEMMTLVNKKAKAAITTTGKRRANGLDAQGQSFYQAIKPIIKAAITNDQQALDKIAEELSDTDAIDEVLAKQEVGDKLTTKEQALIDKVLAFDTFGDILNMELEEVQNLLDGLKGVRSESIVRLNEKRAERAAQREAMTEEANNQIRDSYEMLFNADGTPKDRNQLNQDKAAIWQAFKDRKVWSSLKQWLDRYDFVTSPISDYFRKKLAHLGTISNILDKTGTFFTDNLYRALNRMDESNKTGYLNEMNGLDDMANSINGVTKGYKQIRRMIESVGVVKMVIDGKDVIYNGDQLLRIYALSLNEVQRNKLKNMGFTEDKINDIKKKLGPETIEFADKLVEYFSNEYFESINDIYALVNDVNLGYVENYFPTQTLAAKVDGKLLEDGDFNGIFNAESSPAFKERTDMSSPVDLSASFTNVVESHFQAMERYKAYAVGVKRLNELFKIPSVNVLLEETGLKSITKNLVNMSVNPNAGVKQTQTKLSAAMNKFSGYALAFKLAQIQKQATAIVAAYEDYQFLKGRKMPALDTAMFIIDVAKALTFARANFNKFYNLSGNFRDRVNKGVEGDVYGLESGGKIFKPLSQKATRLADVKRFIKSAAASPTMVGDIISVYGYMANYNRDIANGMSPEAALEKFNNYNATLQSRRATDKSTLQFSQNELTRAFTMFGSTGLLQINKVAMAYKNIMRSIANGKVPSGKDTRAFAINLGVANALFVGASYIFALIKGDDEDKEKVKDKMFEALVGLNLLYQIPLIGGAAEEVANAIKGEKTMGGDVTNPYTSVFRKIKKQYDEDNNVIQNFRPIAEFALGMQFDPFIGLYEGVTDEFNDDIMYDILGISPSYRPQNASSLENMNKSELKKYNPDEYERLYGPGSDGYDEEQAKKEAKAAERKARKDAMDDYYNYSSGDGVKRGGSRIGGRGGSRTGGSRTK